MKNILSICAVAVMILSLASCANNTNDTFQSKVDLLVNDRLASVKDSLASNCNKNMETAIAARVDAAKAKRKAAVSKPKTITAPAATTTPVYVPPVTTTYTPPTSTTTTVPKTSTQVKSDKIKDRFDTPKTTAEEVQESKARKVDKLKDRFKKPR